MSYKEDFMVAFGSFITSGVVTALQSPTISFGNLATVLTLIGVAFVVFGAIERFVYTYFLNQQNSGKPPTS